MSSLPKIILDTDIDSDCDDAGALGVLHALADQGECEILATVSSSQNPFSGPCIDVINTYYHRPQLPIGAPKGRGVRRQTCYGDKLAAAFPHSLKSTLDARDAMELYAEVLAGQPYGSVTIVTIGFLTNIANLLQLPATAQRPSGPALIQSKVKAWVCMGGNFRGKPAHDDLQPDGNHNFTCDPEAAYYAVHHWPGAVTFVGREIGSVPSGLAAGARLIETPESNPVRMAYQHFFGGRPQDRHVADLTTVLYAVRGLRHYWEIESAGYMDLQPDMTFTWRYEKNKNQAYLFKKLGPDGAPNDRYIESVLNPLLLQPPAPNS